jgi:hypothetical protein
MKKIEIAIIAILGLAVTGAQASVILGHTSEQGGPTRTHTVSDLNTTPPSSSGDNTPYASGTFSAASSLGAGDSFSMVYTAALDWDASAAQTAISNGTFNTYVGGLTPGNVDSTADAFYPTITTGDDGGFNALGEVMFITFNTANLTTPGSSLVLQELYFSTLTLGDRTDFLIYDASANAVIEKNWDVKYDNGTVDTVTGSWTLETGDMVVLAVGASNGASDTWRLQTMTLDIIPEPATIGLIAATAGGLIFIRRFMI